MYVVEHQIPSKEGGVVEYLGSQQPHYSLKGFISPSMDGPFDGTAASVLSGTRYMAMNADNAKSFLIDLRGSGAQLLRIESTASNQSGYMSLYENGFFFIQKMTLGFEAGRSYPYYPYGIELHGASVATYGNSSGTAAFSGMVGGGLSGYIFWYHIKSGQGTPNGETVNTVGVYIESVASGHLKVAVYSGTLGFTSVVLAQSAPQAVHSGWNYFPLRPSFATASGGGSYYLAIAGDSASASGYVVGMFDAGGTAFNASWQSGFHFSSDFPATPGPGGSDVSGTAIDIVMVTA